MVNMKRTYRRIRRPLSAPEYLTWWAYSLVRTKPPVWNMVNKRGRILHQQHPPQLDDLQQRIIHDLRTDGIALTHLDQLLPGNGSVGDLIEYARQHEEATLIGERKTFLQYALGGVTTGEKSTIDLDIPIIKISLEPRVLDVVNSYMNMWSKLIYFELATTRPMGSGDDAMGSQRWHRDPGMKRIVKMFIYASDVDEGSGPFSYVFQSQGGGAWRGLYPQKQFGRRGMYPPEGAVDKTVPLTDIKPCTGPAGTVIFCDTTGLHKGGFSTSKPRTMYTSVYMAEGDAHSSPMFKYPENFEEQIASLGSVSHYAISRRK